MPIVSTVLKACLMACAMANITACIVVGVCLGTIATFGEQPTPADAVTTNRY